MKWAWVVLAILLLSVGPAGAVLVKLNQTVTENVAGKTVTIQVVGINTFEHEPVAFLNINGYTYIFANGSEQRVDDITVSVSNIIVSDDLEYGEVYISFLALATCDDGVKNQDESDVDCGGSCRACPTGKKCIQNYECSSRTCSNGICLASASCTNNAKDDDETDTDCGGSCPKCNLGKRCNSAKDCNSNLCQNFICSQAQQGGNCFDLFKNNGEEGVDCGGPCQNKCVTVRNASSICGVGCFFLNTDCVCPTVAANKTQEPEKTVASNVTIAPPKAEQPQIQKVVEATQKVFNISVLSVTYFDDNRQVLISGKKAAKLFFIFPASYKVDILVELQTGKVIKQTRPRWAVFAK
ncbi:MAG TPA: hypothetical protein VJB90_02555 [Candidatus Nanoarchaeia archaeon]|nr:hypothetical protein [Candidatus Nanoarchaeia archaeon]